MDDRQSPTVSSFETSADTAATSAGECFRNAPLSGLTSRCCSCCSRDGESVGANRRIRHLTVYVLLILVCAAITCWNVRAIVARLSSKSCEPNRVARHPDELAMPHALSNPMATRLTGKAAVRNDGGCAHTDTAAALKLATRLPAESEVTDLLSGRLPAAEPTSPQTEASAITSIFVDNYAVIHVGKSGLDKNGLGGEMLNWRVRENSSSSSGSFAYSGGHVKVLESGYYFVYAQVGFLMFLDNREQSTEPKSYDLMRKRNRTKITLARGGGSLCWIQQEKSAFALQSSFVGRVAYLQRNDELYVLMSDPEHAWHDHSRTFFGAYFLSDRSR